MENIANNKIGTYPYQLIIDQMKNVEEKKAIITYSLRSIYEICIVKYLIN